MRISDEQFLLVLDYDADSKTHFIKTAAANGGTLSSWGPHTRVSPLWHLQRDGDDSSSGNSALADCDTIVFAAIENPQSLFADLGEDAIFSSGVQCAWLSLGSYNVVLAINREQAVADVVGLCRARGMACEVWALADENETEVLGRPIDEFSFYPPDKSDLPELTTLHEEIDKTEEHFKPTLVELTALLSMAASRSAIQLQSFSPDIAALGSTALRFLTDPAALRKYPSGLTALPA